MRCITIVFIFLHLYSFGQADPELISMPPKWKKGQIANFETTSAIKMIIADSMPMNMTSTIRGTIKVLDQQADQYVLEFNAAPNSDLDMQIDLPTFGDSLQLVMDSMTRFLTKLTGPLLQLPTSYVVSNTGEILSLHNEVKWVADFSETFYAMLDNFNIEPEKMAQAQPKLDSLMNAQMGAVIETGVNQMNTLFMGHTLQFPVSGAYKEESQIGDVSAPMHENAEPVKGWIEVKAVENTASKFIGQLELTYDPEDYKRVIKNMYPTLDVSGEPDAKETRIFTFDKKTGWLNKINEVMTIAANKFSLNSSTTTIITVK